MPFTRQFRFFAAIVILCGAFLLWGWVLWPVSITTRTIPFRESIPTGGQSVGSQQFAAGAVQIRLTWPSQLHTGETGEISVQLIKDELAAAADTQSIEDTLMAEVRIDMPLVRLDPPGSIQQTFNLENLPAFRWKISSDQQATAAGQFWFYLLDVSADGSVAKQPLLAVPIEIKTVQLFGFSENILVWLGAILFGMGLFVLPLHKLF